MELLCAVYMDLPHAYQAYLFATININQRKVNKSLAYEQFGYNLDDEESEGWAPDKLAVYSHQEVQSRSTISVLSTYKDCSDKRGTFYLQREEPVAWQVSTACVVEGIARLLSQNPKKDRNLLHQKPVNSRSRSFLTQNAAPLRSLYIQGQDERIYNILMGYFTAVKDKLWDTADSRSYIKKTVGIQALFDVFRNVLKEVLEKEETEREKIFIEKMEQCKVVNFADSFFQASGTGRSRIRNCLELRLGTRNLNTIWSESDREEYKRLCQLE